jgi:creatinine amidohydrolase/Fe(II)-dependent formamide hydrolase-like protein
MSHSTVRLADQSWHEADPLRDAGVRGDATLADAEKGRCIVEAIGDGVVRDIEELRRQVTTS